MCAGGVGCGDWQSTYSVDLAAASSGIDDEDYQMF
eukprot:CAMPEP_0185757710 /NCGR_PEP_ID=MMETSP1174-20130828/16194_1 /TAXON_ID=35687 /ORGANISM="Dictyocha speculum, Strain CCMP1381" /LENGTH=34 /DNA_ID= /DNA_START= /DNA_END= /DNA_ORIENTATION=